MAPRTFISRHDTNGEWRDSARRAVCRDAALADGLTAFPLREQVVQRAGELVELYQVCFGELRDQFVALLGEFHSHDTGVVGIGASTGHAGGFRTVDKANGAVALQQQVVRDLADGRRTGPRVSLDRYQELVLGRRKADGRCLFLAPPQETPHGDAEVQEMPKILLGRLNGTPSSAEISKVS